MTVLIAADSAVGEMAYEALVDAGFEAERVETVAAARVRAATAAAVVVGDLADADPVDLRADLCSEDGSPRLPLVRLGQDDAFESCVDLPVDADELTAMVQLSLRTSEYREAVDDLFERCRELADSEDEEVDSTATHELELAKQRAQTRLREARRAAGRTPYERLFPDVASDEES